MKNNSSKNKKICTSVAASLALMAALGTAEAAGLGRITVLSALGQPLKAEVEVNASREELSSLSVRLATTEAYRQAGVNFAPSLNGLRFSLEKRANGKTFVRVTSDRPVDDPFMDVLVELSWNNGRLVREYTFLLDPPDMMTRPVPVAPKTVDLPDTRVEDAGSARQGNSASAEPLPAGQGSGSAGVSGNKNDALPPQPAGKAAAEAKSKSAAVSKKGQEAAPAKDASATASEGTEVKVKTGDTLSKIAREHLSEGVNLDQMLVGILRNNRAAFDGDNMNRLRAGAIVTIPNRDQIASVSASEARKVVMAQASDFNAYRNKLAGAALEAPVRAASDTAQTASGKVTPKVEEKLPPEAKSRDQVKLSKQAVGKEAARKSDEDRIAAEKGLKEAQERQAALEKNVAELQKLVEMKNQNLAQLERQLQSPAKETKPLEKASDKSAEKPQDKPQAKVADKPELAPVVEKPSDKTAEKTSVPAETVPAKPVEAEKPADKVEDKPADKDPVVKDEDKPKVKPKKAPAPAVEEEKGLMDELLDNPLLLGGGATAFLLGALLLVRRLRASRQAVMGGDPLSQDASINSVFRETGQNIDTSKAPLQTTDFSQAGPGVIDTDEVDPVAEAEVYMAYGRDTQAEEILQEALLRDSSRPSVHVKLLEIYHGRRDVKKFEIAAAVFYAQTGGVGPDWEKVARMGIELDPSNPMYSAAIGMGTPSAVSAVPAFSAAAAMGAIPEDSGQALSFEPEGYGLPSDSIGSGSGMPNFEMPAGGSGSSSAMESINTEAQAEIGQGFGLSAVDPSSLESAPPQFDFNFDLGSVQMQSSIEPLPEFDLTDSEFSSGLDTFSTSADSAQDDETLSMTEIDGLPPFSSVTAEPLPVDQAEVAAESLRVSDPTDDLGALDFNIDMPSFEPAPAAPSVGNDLSVDNGLAFESGLMPDLGAGSEGDAVIDRGMALGMPMDGDLAAIEDDLATRSLIDIGADSLEEMSLDVQLTESDFDPAPLPAAAPEFDLSSINLDLAATDEPPVSQTSSESGLDMLSLDLPAPAAASAPTASQVGSLTDFKLDNFSLSNIGGVPLSVPEATESNFGEAATKLDLARAYLDMGDKEGARELLKEVASEGNAAQKDEAATLMTQL